MTGTRISIGTSEYPARVVDGLLGRTRGHMFRRSRPEYAIVFDYDTAAKRSYHMLFVPFALDIVFVVDGVVQDVERLDPWTGWKTGRADTVVELPAGDLDVEPGDDVQIEG